MAKPALSQILTRFIPNSTFAQTALLIGGLLFINQLVSYLSVTHYFIGPSYQQINKLISNQINTLFLNDISTLNDAQKQRLKQSTGVQFHDQISAMHAGVGNATYYDFMTKQVSEHLQDYAEVRVKTGEDYVVWIKPPQNKDMWISIPLSGASEKSLSPLTMYFIVIGALSVTGGWLFVRRLNRPLQALQSAARKVGQGHFPKPLALEGSTEVVSVTKAFNQMSQGIKQLESDRIIMTAGISHDLRTPLTRIRLASEMLPEDQTWVKDGIDHDIADLNAIIDQFIDYARQDQQEEMESANLNDLITECVEARRVEANHNIETNLIPLPPVKLRIVGIKRVIENLIENAFKYGSDHITIKSGFVDNKKFVFCAVRDFGAGIHEDKLEDLFTPFRQGDDARGSSGSGLGLAIVKRIIESHGGKMNFSNHPDGGLNAGFLLPVSASNKE